MSKVKKRAVFQHLGEWAEYGLIFAIRKIKWGIVYAFLIRILCIILIKHFGVK
ncbi:MAG: hypothetical protein ACM3P0_14245 [Acidobacteriota bacterium]